METFEAAGAEPPVVTVNVDNRDATVASEVSASPTAIDVVVAVVEVSGGHDAATTAAAPNVIVLPSLHISLL